MDYVGEDKSEWILFFVKNLVLQLELLNLKDFYSLKLLLNKITSLCNAHFI